MMKETEDEPLTQSLVSHVFVLSLCFPVSLGLGRNQFSAGLDCEHLHYHLVNNDTNKACFS